MARLGGHNYRRRRIFGRVMFVFFLITALLVFFAGQANDRVLDGTKTQAESAVSPLMTYVTMPVRGFENFVTDLRERGRAHTENQRLKSELARLSDIEARANALAIKLSRFETILNVDVSSGIPEQKIAARAVMENNGPFVRSSLLNAGSAKGIQKGYAVMTVDGLLGHVVRVGQNSARVLRLEDLNSRISVMSVRSQSRAILTGDNSRNPKLSFLTETSDWTEGDVVITSGDDGVLPPGLPIGYVLAQENDVFPVDLYVNDNHVDWVWVYPHDPVSAPEDDPILEPEQDTAQVQTETLSNVPSVDENSVPTQTTREDSPQPTDTSPDQN